MLKTKLWLAQRGLNSDSAQRRLEAVQRIRALKDPDAIEVLVEALRDEEAAVRAEVVSALGEIESRAVIKPLVAALRDHSDAVQELAAQALKKVGDASVVDPLVGVLLRGTPGVQYHAAQTLRALNWSPRTMGEQIPFYVACGDFKRVTMFGSAAISALTAVLRGGSYERRIAAAQALAEVGESGVLKPLLGALKDPEPLVRSAAANGLARLGDQQATHGLVSLLRDRERNVRVAVVSALGQLGDTQAVKALQSPGLFAVELFLSTNDEILVNEIAPRAHNSGHQTIEGNLISQYDMQLRIFQQLPLGLPTNRGFSAMYNLIGEAGSQGNTMYQGLDQALAIEGVFVHQYGKATTKPGRKMGHVTIVDNNKASLLEKLSMVKRQIHVIGDKAIAL